MSRLLTLGVLSQAGDPAKALADAYCTYVISQGALVDYATVYNIYKDEYLTDPDKDKLITWFDARAGKTSFGGIYPESYKMLFSLIYPYISGTSNSIPWKVENDKILKRTTTTPVIYFNMYGLHQDIKNLKTVAKLDWLPSQSQSSTPFTYYFGLDNLPSSSVSHYLRFYYGAGGISPRSYLTHYELTNASTITHPQTLMDLYGIINSQEIDYLNKIHRNTFNGDFRQLEINPSNTHKIIQPTSLAYMYVYDYLARYWEKVYKM